MTLKMLRSISFALRVNLMNEENGKVIECKCILNEEKTNFVIEMEIEALDSWGNCYMSFDPSTSILVAEALCDGNPKNLIGETIRLLPHPKGGTYAPIAISKGMLSQWFYKDSILM